MVLAAASAALAATIPALYQQTKEHIRAGSWNDALSTMSSLEAEASKPGNEEARVKLQAPLAFYRGVCEANLDQTAEARASFQAFLADQPNATMDPAMYSKKAIAAFEAARKSTSAPAERSSGGSPSLFKAFQEFKAPPNLSEPADEFWADGPWGGLMTAEEKKTWVWLATADREEFVEKFWESRTPNPGSRTMSSGRRSSVGSPSRTRGS